MIVGKSCWGCHYSNCSLATNIAQSNMFGLVRLLYTTERNTIVLDGCLFSRVLAVIGEEVLSSSSNKHNDIAPSYHSSNGR